MSTACGGSNLPPSEAGLEGPLQPHYLSGLPAYPALLYSRCFVAPDGPLLSLRQNLVPACTTLHSHMACPSYFLLVSRQMSPD